MAAKNPRHHLRQNGLKSYFAVDGKIDTTLKQLRLKLKRNIDKQARRQLHLSHAACNSSDSFEFTTEGLLSSDTRGSCIKTAPSLLGHNLT